MTLWLVLGKRGPICRAPFGGEHPLDPSATALSLPSSDFRDQVLALADVQVEALRIKFPALVPRLADPAAEPLYSIASDVR
jgi:hypothetical protein